MPMAPAPGTRSKRQLGPFELRLAIRGRREDTPAMKTLPMFLGGEWVQAVKGGTRAILNPADNEPIAEVTDG